MGCNLKNAVSCFFISYTYRKNVFFLQLIKHNSIKFKNNLTQFSTVDITQKVKNMPIFINILPSPFYCVRFSPLLFKIPPFAVPFFHISWSNFNLCNNLCFHKRFSFCWLNAFLKDFQKDLVKIEKWVAQYVVLPVC